MSGLGARVLAVTLAAGLVASGAFFVPPAAAHEPVPFDDTVVVGIGGADVREAAATGVAVPRVQAFYSGYRYVVGYYGVAPYAATQAQAGHGSQFGRVLSVYVSDFAGTGAHVGDDGLLRVEPGRVAGWTPAGETVVVVGSRASTPAGPAAVPFSDREAAAAFAADYGGEVLPWAAAVDRLADETDAGAAQLREEVRRRSAWANRTVAATALLRDRPVSVVVGEDAPTLAAALATAPPNTTVRLPPGTYEGNVTVDRPLTLAGAGNATVIRGDGTGTVVRVTAPRTAVRSLRIAGVGPNGTSGDFSGEGDAWDARIRLAYGRGDAAITFDDANGSLVEHVVVETPASGVIVRNSTGAVVRASRIEGAPTPREGFMGVLAMFSRIVVEDSTFVDGRDAVYTHRAHGIVIRDNVMRDGRFGVHEMYTSDSLVRGNVVREEAVGLIVMTRPESNHLVGNDVRDSEVGISPSGAGNYVARNVVVGNEYGLYVAGSRSLFEANTVVGNDVGIRTGTVLPTNTVVRNDVVANDRPVLAAVGPTRVWSSGGEGNYWGPVGRDRDGDGVVDRTYRPTAPVDRIRTSAPGAPTLSQSPAVVALRAASDVVPGLRGTGVVDAAPRARPVRPAVLARTNATREGVAG
jgi:nitrous oxidase accessory protein NosD